MLLHYPHTSPVTLRHSSFIVLLLISEQHLCLWTTNMDNGSGGGASSSSATWPRIADEPHILAVDDNLVDRKLVERLLKKSSCRVTTAENGLRALEFLGLGDDQQCTNQGKSCESKVNLIITDYCMPGMTGYELLKRIKESSLQVPVVIMSSENIPTRIDKCLEEGAQMFMLKPLKQSDVKKLRSQLIDNRR